MNARSTGERLTHGRAEMVTGEGSGWPPSTSTLLTFPDQARMLLTDLLFPRESHRKARQTPAYPADKSRLSFLRGFYCQVKVKRNQKLKVRGRGR